MSLFHSNFYSNSKKRDNYYIHLVDFYFYSYFQSSLGNYPAQLEALALSFNMGIKL